MGGYQRSCYVGSPCLCGLLGPNDTVGGYTDFNEDVGNVDGMVQPKTFYFRILKVTTITTSIPLNGT